MTPLADYLAPLMSLRQAHEWAEAHFAEFDLDEAPSLEAIKSAAYNGRMGAGMVGDIWVTRESELREYLINFDPQNKTHRSAVKYPQSKEKAARWRERQRAKAAAPPTE